MNNELDNFEQSLEGKTNSAIQAELDAIILEEKRLDIELKREAVAKQRAAINQARDNARMRALSLKQFIAQREAIQKNCNHRKGGIGPQAIITGRGDSPSYSVVKHTLPSGRTMVLCTRCLKEWHEADPLNIQNGQIVPKPATPGWEQAIQFNTDNSPSSSSRFFIQRDESVKAGV